MDIGPWVMFEEIKSSEDKQTLTRTHKLVGYGRSLIIKDRDCSPRRNTSLAKQSRDQRSDLLSRTTHQTIILVRISTKRE